MTPAKTDHFCIGSQNGSILAAKSDPGTNSLGKHYILQSEYNIVLFGKALLATKKIKARRLNKMARH